MADLSTIRIPFTTDFDVTKFPVNALNDNALELERSARGHQASAIKAREAAAQFDAEAAELLIIAARYRAAATTLYEIDCSGTNPAVEVVRTTPAGTVYPAGTHLAKVVEDQLDKHDAALLAALNQDSVSSY